MKSRGGRVVAAIVLATALVAFSAETNYMSLKGFYRWKTYDQTRAWGKGKHDGPKHEGPKDGPNAPEGPQGPQAPGSDGPNADPCSSAKQECQGK